MKIFGMTDTNRMFELLKAAVEHIESFEEDRSKEVLVSLGFTDKELMLIKGDINIFSEEKENLKHVKDFKVHNGEVVWVLNDAGKEFIFSDEEYVDGKFFVECVPFKNYSHYVYEDVSFDGSPKFIAYAWYDKETSFTDEFTSLDEALEWLVSDKSVELAQESETKNSLDDDFLEGLAQEAATEESINIWLDILVESKNKSNVEELSCKDILDEIEDVKGTIRNEEITLGLPGSFAEENIKMYNAYLEKLNTLYDAAKKLEGSSLDNTINKCEAQVNRDCGDETIHIENER